MVTVTISVTVPAGLVVASNQRLHWAVEAGRVAKIREMAWGAWVAAGRPQFESACIVVGIDYPDRRRRDAANLHPTLKALVDGMVTGPSTFMDAGGCLLPDDDDEHLTGPFPVPTGDLVPRQAGERAFRFHVRVSDIPGGMLGTPRRNRLNNNTDEKR